MDPDLFIYIYIEYTYLRTSSASLEDSLPRTSFQYALDTDETQVALESPSRAIAAEPVCGSNPYDEVPAPPLASKPSQPVLEVASNSDDEVPMPPVASKSSEPVLEVPSNPDDEVPTPSVASHPSEPVLEVASNPDDEVPTPPLASHPSKPVLEVASNPDDEVPMSSNPENEVPKVKTCQQQAAPTPGAAETLSKAAPSPTSKHQDAERLSVVLGVA